jgi:hypothetical protein
VQRAHVSRAKTTDSVNEMTRVHAHAHGLRAAAHGMKRRRAPGMRAGRLASATRHQGYEDNIAPNHEPARRFEPDRREAIYLFFNHGLPGRSRWYRRPHGHRESQVCGLRAGHPQPHVARPGREPD